MSQSDTTVESAELWAVAIEGDYPPILVDNPIEYAVTVEDKEFVVMTAGGQGPPGIEGKPGTDLIVVNHTAGEPITGQRAVVLINDLLWLYNPANPVHPDVFYGISLNTAGQGIGCDVVTSGAMLDASFSFTPGPVVASANGFLKQVATPGEPILIIGFAVSTYHLVLRPRTPIFS